VYHPFFRGKQYELIAIRENAKILKDAGFIPIVEPVKESFNGLNRAVAAVEEQKGRIIVVVNPACGDHASSETAVQSQLNSELSDVSAIIVGVLATNGADPKHLAKLCAGQKRRKVALVHMGFADGRALAAALAEQPAIVHHIFNEPQCGKLYRKHFTTGTKVLLRNGFTRQNNRDYPQIEPFSDLHVTFKDEGMDGFGDFLIIGDGYAEGGGPAYAVAIHITCIDRGKDDVMFIHHFVSDRTDTPTDPAGKFSEAVAKLVAECKKPKTSIEKTAAIEEFFDLHRRGHFPGLGYVKKLSMQHHIETLASYFS
jgi:hypothetical protein